MKMFEERALWSMIGIGKEVSQCIFKATLGTYIGGIEQPDRIRASHASLAV
jgi:hypothetical protein